MPPEPIATHAPLELAAKGVVVTQYDMHFVEGLGMVKIDLRTVTLNIPPQEVITRDNVPTSVNAVCYFRVVDPNKAITDVENYLIATSQISQTSLRAVLGKAELDEILAAGAAKARTTAEQTMVLVRERIGLRRPAGGGK